MFIRVASHRSPKAHAWRIPEAKLVEKDLLRTATMQVLIIFALSYAIHAAPLPAPRRTRKQPSSLAMLGQRIGDRAVLPRMSETADLVSVADQPISEAACLTICWAALSACAVAAIATRARQPLPLAVWRSLLAGGLAAALGEVIFFPIEVAKVRLQRSGVGSTSLLSELREVLLERRVTQNGVVAGVLRALIYHGLRLGLFPPLRKALEMLLARDGGVNLGTKVLIGASSGALGAAMCMPLDLVKARLAASPGAYPNSVSALVGIAREGSGTADGGVHRALLGLAALWPRGAVAATVVRAALGSGAQLASYSFIKDTCKDWLAGTRASSALTVVLAVFASTAAYVTASAPADLVKTRLLVSRRDGDAYAGPIDCLRRSVANDGLGVLFRGWGASFVRLLPIALLVMPLLERLRILFGVGSF